MTKYISLKSKIVLKEKMLVSKSVLMAKTHEGVISANMPYCLHPNIPVHMFGQKWLFCTKTLSLEGDLCSQRIRSKYVSHISCQDKNNYGTYGMMEPSLP